MSLPRVVVVNDDPAFLEMLKDFIEDSRNYEVSVIQQGMGAVDQLRSLQPDLVVQDIRLEYARLGYHIIETVRRDSRLGNVPIIACTADYQFIEEYTERLRELNVDTLSKPFQLNDLLELIDQAIPRTKRAI